MHEAWLRLASYEAQDDLSPDERTALASHVMRRVLTDHARARQTAKRDAARRERTVDEMVPAGDGADAVIEVDEALGDLARLDPELATVVELRFFGGYTLDEIARTLGLSIRTITRRWQLARAWLLSEMDGTGAGPGGRR